MCIRDRIEFADKRIVEYEPEQMEMIEHDNAITIHKSQGSECDVIIIPWVSAFYVMLKRNILYTGITRAKKRVYLVGQWKAVCMAVQNNDAGKRNTALGEMCIRDSYNPASQTPRYNPGLPGEFKAGVCKVSGRSG